MPRGRERKLRRAWFLALSDGRRHSLADSHSMHCPPPRSGRRVRFSGMRRGLQKAVWFGRDVKRPVLIAAYPAPRICRNESCWRAIAPCPGCMLLETPRLTRARWWSEFGAVRHCMGGDLVVLCWQRKRRGGYGAAGPWMRDGLRRTALSKLPAADSGATPPSVIVAETGPGGIM